MAFTELVRAGAAALLAAGVLGAADAPAAAAPAATVDVEVSSLTGLTIASGATTGKIGYADIVNRGTTRPARLSLTIDLLGTGYDQLPLYPAGDCRTTVAKRRWTCAIAPEAIPDPGGTLKFPLAEFREGARPGFEMPIRVTAAAAGDANPANDSRTGTIRVVDRHGPDLSVYAPDVKKGVTVDSDGRITSTGPLRPGDHAVLYYIVSNRGDTVVDGIKTEVTLPEGVTFTDGVPECDYSADRSRATCRIDRELLPDDLRDDNEDDASSVVVEHPIVVASGVAAPSSLTGGTVTADPVVGASRKADAHRVSTPSFVHKVATPDADVDASDNSDTFAVIVADPSPSPTPSRTVSPSPGVSSHPAGTGGGDSGGALPVTGPRAGLLGGVGVAVLLTGGALVALARRRRVVLVMPRDDKPVT